MRYIILILMMFSFALSYAVNPKTKEVHRIKTKPSQKSKTVISKPKNDTLYYYLKNKKISLKSTQWIQDKRVHILYGLDGKETYRMEDVRKSYLIATEFHFTNDGSIDKATIHENPGASMYWYETYITFINNVPSTKTSQQFPIERVKAINEDGTLYWNKETSQWVKQESIGCQPPPNSMPNK